MVTEAADQLTAELHRLGDAPGQMSDDEACRFLEIFPLDVLFG